MAETLKPRGESSLVYRLGSLIACAARVVGHSLDTRKSKEIRVFSRPAPEAARTILTACW